MKTSLWTRVLAGAVGDYAEFVYIHCGVMVMDLQREKSKEFTETKELAIKRVPWRAIRPWSRPLKRVTW